MNVNLDPELKQSDPASCPAPSEGRPYAARGGWISWTVLLAIAVAALALAAAHLPAPFKKLGLFAIAYGALVGLVGAWLSQFAPGLRPRRDGSPAASPPRTGVAVVFLVALGGLIGLMAESYRVDRWERERRERADPKQALAKKLLDSAIEPPDAKSQATLEEFRESYRNRGESFVEYLQFRVSGIGIHQPWAATLFWGIELVLGGLAAGWVFYRLLRRPAAELDAAVPPAKLEQ